MIFARGLASYISDAPAFVGPAYGALPPNYGVDRRAITSTYLTDYNQLAMTAMPATGLPGRGRELSSSPTVPAAGAQPGGEGYPEGYSEFSPFIYRCSLLVIVFVVEL